VVRLIERDPVLAPLTTVVTPIQFLGGIAENPDTSSSQTFFATGFMPDDQKRMQRWNEYGVGENLESTALGTEEPSQGVIGFGFARNLGLCERLHLSNCPRPPKDAPTRDTEALGDLPQQDFSGLAGLSAPQSDVPRIDLLAATSGGAPNIVSMRIERVEKQASKEMDDSYVVMNLGLAQQLVYGRNEAKVTGIVLQLHRTEDIGAARKRLSALFATNHLNLEVRDYHQINSYLGQTLSFFQFMFSFIAVLIGVVVLFTVSNTMGMSVMERIAEIGTTRALGARRSRIRSQFLLEGALLGVLGASVGVGLAFVAATAVNSSGLTWTPPGDAHPIPLKLYIFGAPQTTAAVWAVLVVIATTASLIPAHRAARLAIVDALRHV
jgi:putative ABC transport system permease protein